MAVTSLLAGAYLHLARDGSTPAERDPGVSARPSATSPASTRPAAVPTATLRAALGDADRCRDVPGDEPAVRCRSEHGSVQYSRPRSLAEAYRRAIGPNGRGGERRASSACAGGQPEERAWSRPHSPTVTAGRFACKVVDGHAHLWWTEAATGVLAHATRADGDLGALFAWWLDGAPTVGSP